MPVASAKKILDIAQAANPKLGIVTAVGDITKEEVLYDLVLIGTYIQPEKTKGGIILARDTLSENEWQGTAGLILKMGPDAEKIAEESGGPKTGDWVVSSIKDGWSLHVNDAPCRLVPYERLRMKISDPKVIFDA